MTDEENNGYSKLEVEILTKLAKLEEQFYNLAMKVNDIHGGYQAQWKKIDAHSDSIASLNAKASIFGSLGGVISAFLTMLFARLIGKN